MNALTEHMMNLSTETELWKNKYKILQLKHSLFDY